MPARLVPFCSSPLRPSPAYQIFELDGLPTKLAHFILGISDNQLVIMFALFVFLIIVGMFMDATAAIYILVPILLPVVKQLGVSPLFFVVFLVITLSFGLITPSRRCVSVCRRECHRTFVGKGDKIGGAVAVPDRRHYLYLYPHPADHHRAHRPDVPQRLTEDQNKRIKTALRCTETYHRGGGFHPIIVGAGPRPACQFSAGVYFPGILGGACPPRFPVLL